MLCSRFHWFLAIIINPAGILAPRPDTPPQDALTTRAKGEVTTPEISSEQAVSDAIDEAHAGDQSIDPLDVMSEDVVVQSSGQNGGDATVNSRNHDVEMADNTEENVRESLHRLTVDEAQATKNPPSPQSVIFPGDQEEKETSSDGADTSAKADILGSGK